MKKLIILTLVLCFMASASFATFTRVKTMGNAYMTLEDEYNIWLFPSTLYDYPELFIAEFTDHDIVQRDASFDIKANGYYYDEIYTSGYGTGGIPRLGYISPYIDGFTNLGAHFTFGEDKPCVLGVYFSESRAYVQTDFINPSSWFDVDNDVDFDMMQNRRIDLFYARMLGENKFGFHLGWVKSGWENDYATSSDPDDPRSTPAYGINMINVGLGLTAMEDKLDLGFDFKMLSWTDENSAGEKDTESDGSMSFKLAGRYFNEVNQKVTLIPHAKIMYEKLGVKVYNDDSDPDLDLTGTFTGMKFAGGLGMNYNAAANVLAVTDIGFKYNTQKLEDEVEGGATSEDKLTSITMPYFKIGMEATVFDWFDLRLGGVSYWMWDSFDYANFYSDDNTEKQNSVMTEFYLGGGFHWNNLYLDAYLNPEFLTEGVYFVNGDETDDFAYQVSLKYLMF